MNKINLAGRRILVVEDELILSLDLCAQIEEFGGVVVGPAPTLEKGRLLFSSSPLPDGGILNIRIGKNMIYPLADDLLAAGVPFIFATCANKRSIPQRYAGIPLVGKPIDILHVVEELFPVCSELGRS